MFLRKILQISKFTKYRFNLSTNILKNFSGSHGHDSHNHGHEEDDTPSHKPLYDRVSYNKKLKRGEREP